MPNGMMNRKIITVACIVKIWLHSSGSIGGDPGSASWVRTSSAARPPRTKKMKVETMYRMPIFLWSVVVSQAPPPRRAGIWIGVRDVSAAGGATTGGAAVVAIDGLSNSRLLQRLEESDDLR